MVEYVPTQIVSEYFRTTFTRDWGRPVHGLLYQSAVSEGGVCCALFVARDDCHDDNLAAGPTGLVLEDAEVRYGAPGRCRRALELDLARRGGARRRRNEVALLFHRKFVD